MRGLDTAQFLTEYWQKAPLLIPQAIASLPSLSPEELAGLALEEDVDARLIKGAEPDWALVESALDENSFAIEGPWTLLVDAVDQHIAEVAALRQYINFLPGWRFDDIMVSYASDGGSVGPHFDQYDVFLVQGQGQRRWRLGQRCHTQTPQKTTGGLTLLENFHASSEYLLSPGDALYVPPGVAHWGVAEGPCMTYSLGFRAPRVADLLSRRVDQQLEHLDTKLLLTDADRRPARPGEICDHDVSNALQQLSTVLATLEETADWFGELVTDTAFDTLSRPEDMPVPPVLQLQPQARWAWHQQPGKTTLFSNGISHPVRDELLPLIIRLCAGDSVHCQHCNAPEREFLKQQWQAGILTDE